MNSVQRKTNNVGNDWNKWENKYKTKTGRWTKCNIRCRLHSNTHSKYTTYCKYFDVTSETKNYFFFLWQMNIGLGMPIWIFTDEIKRNLIIENKTKMKRIHCTRILIHTKSNYKIQCVLGNSTAAILYGYIAYVEMILANLLPISCSMRWYRNAIFNCFYNRNDYLFTNLFHIESFSDHFEWLNVNWSITQ